MARPYYALPLRLDEVLQKKGHPTCSLPESIAQNLFLIITTNFNESRFDATFGCSIWDEDFGIQANSRWKEDIRQSVEVSVAEHEKRLGQVRVRIELADQETVLNKSSRRIKRRLTIWVDAIIARTNERFSFQRSIYISPLSVD